MKYPLKRKRENQDFMNTHAGIKPCQELDKSKLNLTYTGNMKQHYKLFDKT